MLHVSFQGGFIAFLLVSMGGLAAALLVEFARQARHNWDLSRHRLCFCPSCSLTFVMDRHAGVARCPRCNSLTRVRKPRI